VFVWRYTIMRVCKIVIYWKTPVEAQTPVIIT